ncbi:MAG: carbamoyl phosphate synthase small subunit [Gracilibacteraceae bacterium]|jgi:carbamoyl-phosphate synthase small subunit|nr:carbamoyl phosphate synthase small subunit [Gracilibacteraceae bacterium]
MEETIFLILANGRVFPGKPFGATGEITGELVFTTAMTGYLETLTDPSYYGQIVIQTFPLIGNYGVIPQDLESSGFALRAYIVREWCQDPSNFRSEGRLDTFLAKRGVIGLCGVDTRALTRIVREYGVMNARVSRSPELSAAEWASLREFRVTDAVDAVTCPAETETEAPPGPAAAPLIVLWDFGAKENIRRELLKRGCRVRTVPGRTGAERIRALRPDGLMLTNGPGDPAENTAIIAALRELASDGIPTFGICLGHQLLALSQGAQTVKLKYGHRGANQPARHLPTGRVYITSQNHGYAVVSETLPPAARASFLNVNDGTCEGVDYDNMPAFSVQFHPEASAGPLDTGFLFDRFLRLVREGGGHAAR